MPQDWTVLKDFANNLTVVAVLVIGVWLLVTDKVHTKQHTEDVVKGLEQRNADLLGERDRAVGREELARRELAENNAVLNRLEVTVREALQALARRR